MKVTVTISVAQYMTTSHISLLGGPLREFLHLVVAEIHRNNTLLCGEQVSRTLRHNIRELERNTYYHIGALLATSIIHGGPAPSFFCNAVVDYIVFGLSAVKATIDDVPDAPVKKHLEKVTSITVLYQCPTASVLLYTTNQ